MSHPAGSRGIASRPREPRPSLALRESLQDLLHEIESRKPYLFVDELSVTAEADTRIQPVPAPGGNREK